jgi:hypothetical protein
VRLRVIVASRGAAVTYDEFSLLYENAAEFGIPWSAPPIVRRELVEVDGGRAVSTLVWGTGEPVAVVEGAGHSVQGDRPIELAALLREELA